MVLFFGACSGNYGNHSNTCIKDNPDEGINQDEINDGYLQSMPGTGSEWVDGADNVF
ncbi:MAG TPA: hypothetical protein VN372_10180 [Methanospirillum sp.]|nr:hypothetical protein [Methanospirillum sp.]